MFYLGRMLLDLPIIAVKTQEGNLTAKPKKKFGVLVQETIIKTCKKIPKYMRY